MSNNNSATDQNRTKTSKAIKSIFTKEPKKEKPFDIKKMTGKNANERKDKK